MTNFAKLLDLSDYADAKKIMETVKGLSESAYTLAQTAYQIKETQPNVARNFLKTVIKECEDEEKTKETDGGSDTQSSSTTGLEKIGSEGDADESMTHASNTKDQMGVAIGEMAPPMGMPPQQPQPPIPQQPQQQMQYTIQEAKAIRQQFKLIQEALKNLDKKITETTISATKSLDIGSEYKGEKPSRTFIKETVDDVDAQRRNIKKFNDAINKGTI